MMTEGFEKLTSEQVSKFLSFWTTATDLPKGDDTSMYTCYNLQNSRKLRNVIEHEVNNYRVSNKKSYYSNIIKEILKMPPKASRIMNLAAPLSKR